MGLNGDRKKTRLKERLKANGEEKEREKNSDPHFNLERAQKHTGIDRKGLGEEEEKEREKRQKLSECRGR